MVHERDARPQALSGGWLTLEEIQFCRGQVGCSLSDYAWLSASIDCSDAALRCPLIWVGRVLGGGAWQLWSHPRWEV